MQRSSDMTGGGKRPISGKFIYDDLVNYQEGSIVSREIINKKTGTVTIFAFDENQSLSTHSAPYDALLQVIEGSARVIIEGVGNLVGAPEAIIMPADKPHSVHADKDRFKMLLTMIKEK